MTKLCTLLLAAALALSLSAPALATENDRQYNFTLTANGAAEIQAETGDVIEVVCTLTRTDGATTDLMFALNDDITWDNAFFHMVPDSLQTKSGVNGNWKALPRGIHFVSASRYSQYGSTWSCENVICSFQLEVVATAGVGRIESRNACVTAQDASEYPLTLNDAMVTVDSYTTTAAPYVTYDADRNRTMYKITATPNSPLLSNTAFYYDDESEPMFRNADGSYSWLLVVPNTGAGSFATPEALAEYAHRRILFRVGTARTYNDPGTDAQKFNVNMSSAVNVSDAVLTYDIARGLYEDFSEVSMDKFLNAGLPDGNSAGVTAADAQAVVNYILAN